MAFHGDLSSYPLPELLQWLDTSRKTGALQLQWEAGDRKLFLVEGHIVATGSPALWERIARAIDQGGIGDGQALMRTLAAGHALFESLRWLDDAADVERVLPLDSMVVRSTAAVTSGRGALQRVLLHACSTPGGMNLGRLRLVLGLQRGMVARGVYELLRGHLVEVEGALEADPVADMLEKGAILSRERQFEAAGLVFSALLHSDPSDRRVREFARMVEREHLAELYRGLPPLTVIEMESDPSMLAPLRQEERQIAALDQWSLGRECRRAREPTPRARHPEGAVQAAPVGAAARSYSSAVGAGASSAGFATGREFALGCRVLNSGFATLPLLRP